jgi:hypothetical protein
VVWELAERFGWTLEYIESLPLAKLHDWEQILDGRTKGKAERQRRDHFMKRKR